jgi:ETC complex I subunit conserved region
MADTMGVRIYQPAKSAMQSGVGTGEWVVEPEVSTPVAADPLMGWIGSSNTDKQVVLTFATREEAIAYAEREGLAYTIVEPLKRKHIRRTYADNFKFGRIGSWTH